MKQKDHQARTTIRAMSSSLTAIADSITDGDIFGAKFLYDNAIRSYDRWLQREWIGKELKFPNKFWNRKPKRKKANSHRA